MIYLAASEPTGWGGAKKLSESLAGAAVYLAAWPQAKQREQFEGMARVHLAAGLDKSEAAPGSRFVTRDAMLGALGDLEGDGVRVYGAAPGGVEGRGAMSLPQLAEAGLRVYGAASSATDTQGDAMNLRLGPSAVPAEAAGPRVHPAERDPQHHGWAGRGAEAHRLTLRILLSYHYYKDEDLDELVGKYFAGRPPDIFVDSGAYSAHTQGLQIDLAGYCGFVRRFGHLVTTYANLDVIGDAEATLANQRAMEAEGLAPLPVFHFGEDWRFLDTYIERYPYIALGGVAQTGTDKSRLARWLVQCFRRAEGRAVFHGFAVTTWQILKDFRWYSVDSSSWGQGFRYGNVPVFDPAAGRFRKMRLRDRASCYACRRLLGDLGFDPEDFADPARYDRAKVCAVSALAYMQAEAWLRRRWGPVVIPGREGGPAVPQARLMTANHESSNMSHARLGELAAGGKLFLAAEGAGAGGKDLAALAGVAGGPRVHLSDTSSGINLGRTSSGLSVYLAEGAGAGGKDLAALAGVGVGDSSRAAEYLGGVEP